MAEAGPLVRNTIINGIAAIVSTLIAFVLTRVFLEEMGRAAYGLWLLALTLTFDRGYLAIMDLGFGTAALQSLAGSQGDDRPTVVAWTIATYRRNYLVLSICGMVLILTVGRLVLESITDGGTPLTIWLIAAVMAVRLPIDMAHAANLTILEASSKFLWIRLVETSVNVAWLIAVVVGTSNDIGVVGLSVAALAIATAQWAVSTVLARHVESYAPFRWSNVSAETNRHLWSTGQWVALHRVSGVIYAQMDRLIIGFALGVAAVSDYEVPYKIQALGVLILVVLPSAVFPAAARLGNAADRRQLTALFHRGTRLSVGVCIPPLLALTIMAGPIVRVWVGPEYLYLAGSVRLFTAWTFLAVFHVIPLTMLAAIGRNREVFLLGAMAVAFNLPISILLAPRWGIDGVIVGTLVGYAIVFIPYLMVEQHYFGSGYGDWFRYVVVPIVVPVTLEVVALATAATVLDHIDSLRLVLTLLGIGTLVGWSSDHLISMEPEDKDSIRRALTVRR